MVSMINKVITFELTKDIGTYRRYKVQVQGRWSKTELKKIIRELDRKIKGETVDVEV